VPDHQSQSEPGGAAGQHPDPSQTGMASMPG